jgi:hypothetical protein
MQLRTYIITEQVALYTNIFTILDTRLSMCNLKSEIIRPQSQKEYTCGWVVMFKLHTERLCRVYLLPAMDMMSLLLRIFQTGFSDAALRSELEAFRMRLPCEASLKWFDFGENGCLRALARAALRRL